MVWSLKQSLLLERTERGNNALVVALGPPSHGVVVRKEGVAAPVLAELLRDRHLLALQDVLEGVLKEVMWIKAFLTKRSQKEKKKKLGSKKNC